MAGRYSTAVIRLAADASVLGRPVSAREIERWRQKKLIPAPARTFPGRGSASAYTDSAARQAGEIAKLLDERWRLDEIALPLFARGFEVTEETVKLAFKAHAAHMRRLITRRAPGKDSLTIAEAATRTLARSMRGSRELAIWRSRLSGRGESPGVIAESALMNFVHILLTGEPITADGFEEFLTASGLHQMLAHMSSALGEEVRVDELGNLWAKLDFDEYARLVDVSTLDELVEARAVLVEMAAVVLPCVRVFAASLGVDLPDDLEPVLHASIETAELYGLPIVAWLFREHGAGTREILDAVRANATAIEGSAYLLEHLPRSYWHVLGPNGEAALAAFDPEERASFDRLVQEAFARDSRLRALRETLSP